MCIAFYATLTVPVFYCHQYSLAFCLRECVCVCVCVRERACVRVCVRACVRACVCLSLVSQKIVFFTRSTVQFSLMTNRVVRGT